MLRLFPITLSVLAVLRLLAPSSLLAVEASTEMVEMRDGVHLATDVFWPSAPGQYPTIIIRTPYGKGTTPLEIAEIICDVMEFGFVMQDTRGRYNSEGEDDVFLSDGWGENQDGYDTVEWIVSQPWSDGQVGFFGASAMGITAFLAMGSYHPAIKSAHVGITPWIFYDTVYQDGCFRDALIYDWLDDQDALYMLDLYKEHPIYDELWESLDMTTRPEVDMPIYHWGGWYDVFPHGPLRAFGQLTATTDGNFQRLLMGPWTHQDNGAISPKQGELTYPEDSIIPLSDANPIGWFEETLQGRASGTFDEKWPVRFYLMGDVDLENGSGNRWMLARSWPPPSRPYRLYLHTDGRLEEYQPDDNAAPLEYFNDPEDPSPTIGGGELSLPAGPRDQSELYARGDVLVFETQPLARPVKVVGEVQAVLFVTSDGPDTDFTARLVDVYPDGRAMLVTDGIAKVRYHTSPTEEDFIVPGEIVALEVNVGVTAIAFEAGHRIQLLVSSSNARRFLPSRNNDDLIWGDELARASMNSVFADELHPSQLILPEPSPFGLQIVEQKVLPARADVQAAKDRLRRHAPLRDIDMEALKLEAGRWLLELAIDKPRP